MTFHYIQNGKIWEVVTINFYNQTITLRHENDLLVETFDDKKLVIEDKQMNNFEKIKAMDIDEMAEWFRDFQDNPDALCTLLQCKKLFKRCGYDACLEHAKQWLETEVRE